jgi:hypothetical protein
MSGAIHPLPQYTFMAWCLVKKHRDNFTFFTLYMLYKSFSHPIPMPYALSFKIISGNYRCIEIPFQRRLNNVVFTSEFRTATNLVLLISGK